MALLTIEDLVVNYDSIQALRGINLEVNEGEIITLLGANGAGKSTTMRTVTGLKRCASGRIVYDGIDITHKDTQYMVRNRLILAPEGRQVFPRFTVRDNLFMGAYMRPKEEIAESEELVFSLFPKLKNRINQSAGTLSGGEQQMLAVGRAMMAKPRLLLMDEPSLGLAPLIVNEIFKMLARINEMGTTILLVEQNARVALKHSHRAYVLETGKIVLHDTAEAFLSSKEVQEAYFGGI
jgi:branched-chain amino acid transport system ATP-binding protein